MRKSNLPPLPSTQFHDEKQNKFNPFALEKRFAKFD